MRVILILIIAAMLGGCAFGRTYSYNDAAVSLPGVTASTATVALGVQDARPYVVSGNKPERFVGLMRGGFGNPFDVNTESGNALAQEVRDALVKAMKGKGMSVSTVNLRPAESSISVKRRMTESQAKRWVLVTIREWKSDTMVNTSIHHDIKLAVFNERGEVLATNEISGSDNLGGMGISPGGAIVATFARKLDALFDDDKVAAALRS